MNSDNRLSRIPLIKERGTKRSSSIQSYQSSSGNRRSNSAEQISRFHPNSQQRAKVLHQEFVKDPRPINEKKFKDIVFQKLLKFLAKSNYPHKLKLLQISNIEFRRIFEFIVSLIIPGYKVLCLDEDVPNLMNKFGYPFSISKATMTTIGAPHSYPQLLAILDFLCDYVDIQLSPEEDDRDSDMDGKIFSEYYSRCYNTYLSQSSDSLDFPQHDRWLKDKLLDKIDVNRQVEMNTKIEMLESLNAAEVLMESNNKEIESLKSLISDKQKMIEYNNNYMQYNNEQHSVLQMLKNETVEYEQRIKELNDAVFEKELKYSAQKKSGHLLNELQQEHHKLSKINKTMSSDLEKYNIEKSKLIQLTSELHQGLLNGLDNVTQYCQMMGINNEHLPPNMATIKNESYLLDLIPKVLTFFGKLSKQYKDKFLYLELAVAKESKTFHALENKKLLLEHNLHIAHDEIKNLEDLLAENVQMRQNLMGHLDEIHQINNQIKKEEADLQALIKQVEEQKEKNIEQQKDNEICIKECEDFVEKTRAEYQRQILKAAEYFYNKQKLLEVLAKF